MIELVHEIEPLVAFLLTFSTFGLWWSTARMNHIEKTKMTEALSHDNDNMADVAMAEIASHHHNDRVRQLRQIQRRKTHR